MLELDGEWKRKGDVHEPKKYRGIILLSHVLKVFERILGGRLRRTVDCEMGEEQQGFRRETADGMFTLRQLVEKRLVGQENMAFGFIDLEKAYDTVLRDGHDHIEVDGCPRGRGEDGRRHI